MFGSLIPPDPNAPMILPAQSSMPILLGQPQQAALLAPQQPSGILNWLSSATPQERQYLGANYSPGQELASNLAPSLKAFGAALLRGKTRSQALADAFSVQGGGADYINNQIKRQALMKEANDKNAQDQALADYIAQLNPAERQNVIAMAKADPEGFKRWFWANQTLVNKAGLGLGTGSGNEYGAGSIVQTGVDASGQPIYGQVQPNLQGGKPLVTPLSGVKPAFDPGIKGASAEATATGRENVKLSFDKPEVIQRTDMAVSGLERSKQLAADLINDPGLAKLAGVQGLAVNDITARFGPDVARAKVKFDALLSQMVVNTLTAMRNASKSGGAFGNITNYEDALLKDIQAIKTIQGPADLQNAVRSLWQHLEQSNQIIQNFYKNTYGEDFGATRLPDLPPELQPQAGSNQSIEDRMKRYPKAF